MADRFSLIMSCIDSVSDRVRVRSSKRWQLNEQQCSYLAEELLKVSQSLQAKLESGNFKPVRGIQKILVHLHAAVKRAQLLVERCCCETSARWRVAALTALDIKEEVIIIVLNLHRWTSVLDIATASVEGRTSKENLEILKIGEECYQRLFKKLHSSKHPLQVAALQDHKTLLEKIAEYTEDEYAYGVYMKSRLTPTGEAQSVPQLKDYKALRPLGRGVMGMVWEVEWMGHQCGLKISEGSDKSEATILDRLHHPNIVRFFHHWEDSPPDRNSYMVMELLPSDLQKHILRELSRPSSQSHKKFVGMPFDLSVAIDLMLQVAQAMQHVHDQKLLHRDLKTSNILVKPVPESMGELHSQGYLEVKLADFGLAKEYINSSISEGPGPKVGTTVYGAPEIFGQEETQILKSFPPKADVWSFGMVCWEILTGKMPFSEEKCKGKELHKRIKYDGLRPSFPKDCPAYLQFCIASCWEEDKRRPSFTDLCRMLRHAQLLNLGLICLEDTVSWFGYSDRAGYLMNTMSITSRSSEVDSTKSWFRGGIGLVFNFRNMRRGFKPIQPTEEDSNAHTLQPTYEIVLARAPRDNGNPLPEFEGRINQGEMEEIGRQQARSQEKEESSNTELRNAGHEATEKVKTRAFSLAQENIDSTIEAAGSVLDQWNVSRQDSKCFHLAVSNSDMDSARRQSGKLASTKTRLICTLCEHQMISPSIIDSGLSFCKACIEERFGCGSMTCTETHLVVNKSFVANVTPQNVVACFGEAEEQPAAESSGYFTEDGESSDDSLSRPELSDFHVADESLDREALLGLEFLDSPSEISVRKGFSVLIRCASSPGGRLAVFNAKYTRPPPAAPTPPIMVIPTVIEKVKTQDSTYPYLAVKLMAALTSSEGGASQKSGEPDSRIILEDDALNFIVSLMNEEGFAKTRLLAAETLAHNLVHRVVRNFVLCKEGIVPSLVALSNANILSPEVREKTNIAGLKGLQRLAKCDTSGNKTKKIVLALIKLLKKGLRHPKELKIMVRDSLVALDNQIQAMDHGPSTREICKMVWKEMKELMKIEGILVPCISVLGRMAIINIMTKLSGLYKESIDEHVFLYLLKMTHYTRSEVKRVPEPSSQPLLPQEGIEVEELKNLTELANRSIRLLCFCVTHGQSMAESVLRKNVEEGRTLVELLVHRETLGISDESNLEVLSILVPIDMLRSQAITILVKILQSKSENCRHQAAKKLRTLVEAGQHLTEFKKAGGVAALLLLLEDLNHNCRQDALVAVHALCLRTVISVDELPLGSILHFLTQEGPNEVMNAAIRLFDLMVKGKAISADKFLEFKGALEAMLRLSDIDSDNLVSQESVSIFLKIAKEDQSIRTRIAAHDLHGLDILVKYARNLGNNKVKELLIATLVLLCGDGKTYQEAVVEANGHKFLITCLQKRISKEEAARGLLELIRNTCTIEVVLDSGFVATALESIDRRFACKDIARGLNRISSIKEGLHQIYSDWFSVPALLILLEHCPNSLGRNAAALTISRLYPLLHRKEDTTRRERIIDKCHLLLDYLDPFDLDHVYGVLKAIATLVAEPEGRKTIHLAKGFVTLCNHFSGANTEIQGLLLKILSVMSSDISENRVENYSTKMIRDALMDVGVGKKVFKLMRSIEFGRRMESVKDALILIRNLSLAASYASSILVEEGAVSALLEVLNRHERSLLIVTELALKAIKKVLDDPKGKEAFIRRGGIETLVAIVKVDTLERVGDDFGGTDIATIILITLAQDPYSRKLKVIKTIFDGDILTALSQIAFYCLTDRIKNQAAVLIKLLARYGPCEVFVAIKYKNCLNALLFLLQVPACKAVARDALDFLSAKNKACRLYIQDCN